MDADKFWSSMEKQADGCWIWKGATGRNGYGAVSYGGSTHQAHRLAWRLARGPIPQSDGYHSTVVAHICDVRNCCNPDHLRLASQQENMLDVLEKGRNFGPKLTQPQALQIISMIQGGISCNELAKQFGVSPAAIDAIAKKRTWRHLTKGIVDLRFAPREANGDTHRIADYDKIRSLLGSGMSARKIAKLCNTTHPTVNRVAKAFREKVATPFRRMTGADRERISDLHRCGVSQREIAEHLNISQASVSRTLAAGG